MSGAASAQQKMLDAVKQKGQLAAASTGSAPALAPSRRQGCLDGPRRRLLQGDRSRRARRCQQGSVCRRPPPRSASRLCNSRELDVLIRNTTWTLQRDSAQGLTFTGVNFYDGQGFMVKKSAGREIGQGAWRRYRLRAKRNDDGAQSRRLLPYQQYCSTRRSYSRRSMRRSRPIRPTAAMPTPPMLRASIRRKLLMAKPGRSRGAARHHLQGAAGAGGAPGRQPVVHHCQVGALCLAERGGSGRHASQRRSDARRPPIPTSSACSARKAISARAWGSTTTGPTGSSSRSATTARCFDRNVGAGSRLKIERGLQQISGPRAVCSTRRRSADTLSGRSGDAMIG